MSYLSQEQKILKWMKAGNTINPIQALRMFKCFRLASRITDLKDKGYVIEKDMVKKNGKRFAQYRM